MATMENAHALIIGVAHYSFINQLPDTVIKDARDIHDVLVDPAGCSYPPENVKLLLDGEADKSAILQELAGLAHKCNEDSTAFIYLSSHGGRLDSGPFAGEYMLPVDALYITDQTLASTAISSSAFTEALRAIKARKITVILDCCHSAGIGQPKEVRDALAPSLKEGLRETLQQVLQSGHGRVIMASSRDTESSYILPGAKNSLFTQHLLGGLKGGVISQDGLIRIFDLFEHIQPLVTKDNANQHPVFKAEIEENFPIALYCGGDKKNVAVITDDGFRYDVYISYVDEGADAEWVWGKLVPRLEAEGLSVAVSDDVQQPGVARVVNVERGIKQARRTLVVLSNKYLANNMGGFENILAQTLGIDEGTWRVLPVKIEEIDQGRLPVRLGLLASANLAHPTRADREFGRLIKALKGPLPTM